MKGLGHLWRPPDFAIESIAFIGKSVSELPLAVLTLHAWGGGLKSPNRTIIKTRPKGRVFIMVRMKGLEPSRPEALAPKASVSTNSTTSACIGRHYCITSLNVCETLFAVRERLCFFALVRHQVHRQGWQDEALPDKTAHRLQFRCQSCSRYP